MQKRILVVEDEIPWRNNLKNWLPATLAQQDSAATTQEAISYLRRFHYDLVLLDLSMDAAIENRANQGIQNYLAARPEGTLYIIVSSTVNKAEVRDAAFKLGAYDVIFKTEIDPDLLSEKVQEALERTSENISNLIADARQKLIHNIDVETEIIRKLGAKGASSMAQLMTTLCRQIAPIARHIFRPSLAIQGNTVLGLVWSRQLGQAISLALTNATVPREEPIAELAKWLGYEERGAALMEKVYYDRIRVLCFSELNVSDEHFELPAISL